MKNSISAFIKAIVNTYAILFFSQNKILGVVLLLVSFLNPAAGISGLCCVLFSLALTISLGYRRETIQAGIYSFNNLLLGIAFGTFYHINLYYIIWLTFASLLLVMVTIILEVRLMKLGLPILSIPFILCLWLVLLGAQNIFKGILQPGHNYLLQQIYSGSAGVTDFHNYLAVHLPWYLSLFFRSVSAILFQDNIITGMLISTGLLIHSRIAFCLYIIGFAAACGFNALTHIYPYGINYYYLGANFMMTSAAVGSFITIPSVRSYLWAVLCIPIVFILINALAALLAMYNLPLLSLPFCVVSITLQYFLLLRKNPGKLQLVTVQHYSPERNLYQFINQQGRLNDLKYFRFHLPFMGSWTVSQGYDGAITHKTDWAEALDFVVEDEEKHTFKYPGTLPEHFYSYNKPVLACGDGVIANVADNIDDNNIGESNPLENWGNTVVIKHLDGLYSKVSHLKKGSVKVKPGDFVKQGDQLGLCGNSGRSPEPHLHFQLQTTPNIDAKTIAYPFGLYLNRNEGQDLLKSFETPSEGEVIASVNINGSIKKAFDFQPGFTAKLKTEDKEDTIEAYTDELSQSYLYSKETGAIAYFINNGSMLYFTSFYGDDRSLLYYFYLAAYKIIFCSEEGLVIEDEYPAHLCDNKLQLVLQDIVAPFYRLLRLNYQSNILPQKTGLAIRARQYKQTFGSKKKLMEATINISNNGLQGFDMNINGHDIKVKWVKESIY